MGSLWVIYRGAFKAQVFVRGYHTSRPNPINFVSPWGWLRYETVRLIGLPFAWGSLCREPNG